MLINDELMLITWLEIEYACYVSDVIARGVWNKG